VVVQKPSTKAGFDPPISLESDILSPSNACLRLDGALGEGVLSPALHQVLLNMARLRNVVSSIKIEGERVDLAGARRVLETGKATSAEEEGVLRLSKAYARLHASHPPPRLTLRSIRDLHRELFEGVLEDGPIGDFKTEDNGVKDKVTGQWVFHATPHEDTEAELAALLTWYEGPGRLLPPAVAAGMFFVEFEAIHPFTDGNGRLGRFLNLLALRQLGFENACLVPIDGRFFRTSDKYYESLAATNRGENYHVWLRYYTKELRKAYDIAVRRADLRGLLDAHAKASTRGLLEWAVTGDGGWFAHSDYPNPRGFSSAAVSGALKDLVTEGILEPEGEKRGRRYRLHPTFLKKLYNSDFLQSQHGDG
jgi:Fic family protein